MNPKTVGLIVFDQIAATDLTGPAEAFSRATVQKTGQSGPNQSRCYQVLTIGIDAKSYVTECGVEIQPRLNLEEAPALDTLIICGGGDLHNAKPSRKLVKWLKHRAPMTRRVVALGSGIYALAATGLLNGHRVAVHWRLAKNVALRFPSLDVNPDALFINDGSFYTCAGGVAALDLSLSLIEEDFGRPIALDVARELILYFHRAGVQEQCSELLRFQIQSTARFDEIVSWVAVHLHEEISVDALAERASCSRRNFSRLFRQVFGTTPAHFVEEVRLMEARHHLANPRNSLKGVAALIGFKSVDSFSRAFERRFGIRPTDYREGLQSLTHKSGRTLSRQLATAA